MMRQPIVWCSVVVYVQFFLLLLKINKSFHHKFCVNWKRNEKKKWKEPVKKNSRNIFVCILRSLVNTCRKNKHHRILLWRNFILFKEHTRRSGTGNEIARKKQDKHFVLTHTHSTYFNTALGVSSGNTSKNRAQTHKP